MNRTVLIDELASRLAGIHLTHPVRVAIDGVDAAGKTILADEFAKQVEATEDPQSGIDRRLPPSASKRRRRGEFSPEGYYRDSFAHPCLTRLRVPPLGPQGDGVCRLAVFDFRTDASLDSPPIEVPADSVLLFEGVFLLRPDLRRFWDFAVFVRADFDVTVARAEQRDLYLFGSAEGVRERYVRRYVPGQQLYFREAAPESRRDVNIDNTDRSALPMRRRSDKRINLSRPTVSVVTSDRGPRRSCAGR